MNRYSKKSDAELRYIIKDASAAARCMRGMDDAAECKYLDQVNDAVTEIARRAYVSRSHRNVSRDEYVSRSRRNVSRDEYVSRSRRIVEVA